MTTSEPLKYTPLYETHVKLGARMMPFGGFEMPVQYSGIIDEHMAVRQAAGLFDVSHMGEIMVEGSNALAFVQHLVTNDASKLFDGRVMYTVMCKPDGGIVDDLLVYRLTENSYMLVVNAANVATDYEWMLANNGAGATLRNVSDEMTLLAIQGPRAFEIVQPLTSVPLSQIEYYHFSPVSSADFSGLSDALLSHTGYTGEPGLEIYCDARSAVDVWDALISAGREKGLKPAGLGARDTLRLEAGYALYGNDITRDTNPIEAGLGWVVKLEKGDFVGRDVIQRARAEGTGRRLIGFAMEERGIPRQGFRLLAGDGSIIGTVTSGTHSPVRDQGIGLGYVINDQAFTTPGNPIGVSVRGRALRAIVEKPPFHKK